MNYRSDIKAAPGYATANELKASTPISTEIEHALKQIGECDEHLNALSARIAVVSIEEPDLPNAVAGSATQQPHSPLRAGLNEIHVRLERLRCRIAQLTQRIDL